MLSPQAFFKKRNFFKDKKAGGSGGVKGSAALRWRGCVPFVRNHLEMLDCLLLPGVSGGRCLQRGKKRVCVCVLCSEVKVGPE